MKRLTKIYIVSLHLVLVGVLWKSDFLDRLRLHFLGTLGGPEITDHYRRMLQLHSRSVDAVPTNSVIFIGDSLTQGLSVAAAHPLGVNYGISGDTTIGVLKRLPTYFPALRRAEGIVIAIGVNDFEYRSADAAIQNYIQIFDQLPQDCPVFISAILPIDLSLSGKFGGRKEWIQRFNAELKRLSEERDWVTFIDSSEVLDTDCDGNLDSVFHVGDGLHLNSAGNKVWAKKFSEVIQRDELKQ